MEQELDAQLQRRTVPRAGMYRYIWHRVVAICGPMTNPFEGGTPPDPQDPWCEGMWEALKLPPGLPDPDVDLRYEAGADVLIQEVQLVLLGANKLWRKNRNDHIFRSNPKQAFLSCDPFYLP